MSDYKVLIVDDDAAVSRILVRVFQRAGYITESAQNGLVALEHLKNHETHFDAMISDIQMPKMNGRELVDHLIASGPYLPGVTFIATSSSKACERDWIEKFPDVNLVEKPVSPKKVLKLVTARLQENNTQSTDDEERNVA